MRHFVKSLDEMEELREARVFLNDTMDKARLVWPDALKTLPMLDEYKKYLKTHWSRLRKDFKLKKAGVHLFAI